MDISIEFLFIDIVDQMNLDALTKNQTALTRGIQFVNTAS